MILELSVHDTRKSRSTILGLQEKDNLRYGQAYSAVGEGVAWEFEVLQCMHFIDPIDVPCSFIIFYYHEKIELQCF